MKNRDLFRLSAMKNKIDKDNIKQKILNSSSTSDETVILSEENATPVFKNRTFKIMALAASFAFVLAVTLVFTLFMGGNEETMELYVRSAADTENYEQYNFAFKPAVVDGKGLYPADYGIASFTDVSYEVSHSESKFIGNFTTNEGISGRYFETENDDGTYTLNFEFTDDYTLYQSYIIQKSELESTLDALVESAKTVRLVSQNESKAPVYAVNDDENVFSLVMPDGSNLSFTMNMPTEDGLIMMISYVSVADPDDDFEIGSVVKTTRQKDNFRIEDYAYTIEEATFKFEFVFDISVSADVMRDKVIIESIKTLKLIDPIVVEPVCVSYFVADEVFSFEAQNGTTLKTDSGIDFYGTTANFSIKLAGVDGVFSPMANSDAKDENGLLHFTSWGLYDAVDLLGYEKQGEFETDDGIRVTWHDIATDNDIAANYTERHFNAMLDFGVLTIVYHINNDFANDVGLLEIMIESVSTLKLVSVTENTMVEGIDDVSKIPADTDSIEHLMSYYEAKGIISGENEIDDFIDAMKRGEERELTVIYWTFTKGDDETFPNGYLYASAYYELKCKDGVGYYRLRRPMYLMGKQLLGFTDGDFEQFNDIHTVYVHTESMYYDEITGKRQSYIYKQYWLDIGEREYNTLLMSHYVAEGSEIDEYENVQPCLVMNGENATMIMRWPLCYFSSRDAEDFAEDIYNIAPAYRAETLKSALEAFEELDIDGKYSDEIEKFRSEYEKFINS